MANLYVPDGDGSNCGLFFSEESLSIIDRDNGGVLDIIATQDTPDGQQWDQVDMYCDGYHLTLPQVVALHALLGEVIAKHAEI